MVQRPAAQRVEPFGRRRLVCIHRGDAAIWNELLEELRRAKDEIHELRGVLPICAWCKKIRDDKGYWNQIEEYFSERSKALFSHGLCPECAQKHYGITYHKIVSFNVLLFFVG